MSTNDVRTETREVSGFDRISLRGFGELVVTQSDRESLTIDAPQDVLDRIETSVEDGQLIIGFSKSWQDWINVVLTAGLSGKRVRYELTVKRLTGLSIWGAARAQVANIETDRLDLDLRGAGQIKVESLDAERLDVHLPGAGVINAAGRATEQSVTISGAGTYDASKLESQRVTTTIQGLGSATVWAVEELEVTIRGVGEVSYYGSPTVHKTIDGLNVGGVKSLGTP